MSIQRTKAGTYEVRWRDANGRHRSKTWKRKVDAEAFEREVQVDTPRGTFVDPAVGKVGLATFADEWLAGAHNLRPKTLKLYRQALAHILAELGDTRLANVTPEAIDEYLAGRLAAGVAPSSVHREFRTLRRLFKVAVARQRIARSPMDHVVAPRIPPTEMRFLTAEELEALADTIDCRYRSLVLTAGWGGLRWGELAGLRVVRVDVDACRVQVTGALDLEGRRFDEPKTPAGRRWVSLPADVAAAVAEDIVSRQSGKFVWMLPGGGPLEHSRFMGRIFRPAVTAAGLAPLRFHDLRHTAVALAIATGAHPKAIQVRMGHSSIQVTLDRYGHLFPEMDTTLVERLDERRNQALRARLHVVR
jgi:integrase